MKKILIFFTALALMFFFAPSTYAANSITNRLKGRLLLQVEKGGAIWYVNPTDVQKYQVTFANALSLFQKLALGITNADLLKIPVDLDSINSNLDSDNDGYPDKTELQNGYSPYLAGSNSRFKTDNNLAKKLKGKLLLQVQQGGAIWYVDVNGIRHNARWNNLMDLFRRLALGITDKDLAMVGTVDTSNWQTYRNSEYGYEIKYPKGWFVYDDTCECMCENSPSSKVDSFNRIKIRSFKRPDECGYSGLGGKGIQVKIQITDKLKSLDDWINNIKLVDPTMKVNAVKDVNIGGIKGKELTLSCDCLIGVGFYRIIERNNMIYEFSVFTQDIDLNNYLPAINQILSTFKFLDNRILLTPENISQYNNPSKDPSSCNEKFDFSSANTTVTYASSNKGISVKLPYNSNWGNNKYKINPYDEYSNRLNFGDIGVLECGWVRSYTLNFLPVKSVNNVITDLSNSDNIFVLEPQKVTINGLEVVKYETGGLCTYPTFQVIGRKYNYELIPACGSGDEFEYLENIVKTIKFLD